MSPRPTPEQQAAVSARGKVIVSASAGSGKTFVMIERLVSLIVGGADVREVLAVTYTRKAAAQMREKLRTALVKAVGETREEGARARLKAQLSSLPLADICTMHVFCARLVRTYFYVEGIDPAFRIAGEDDAEWKTYSARALDETFDEAYKNGGEEFRALLSFYFRKKSDRTLKALVLKMNSAAEDTADPEETLKRAGTLSFEELSALAFDRLRLRLSRLKGELSALSPAFAGNKAAEKLSGALFAQFSALSEADGLFAAAARAEALAGERLPNAPPATKLSGEELDRVLRLKAVSEAFKALKKELRSLESEETERLRHEDASARARALAALALAYRARFLSLKREAGLLDYHDLEHCALRVLRDEDVRAAVRQKYRYVFVDEYQDVNLVQEELLRLAGGEEVFLVGDAKQAIYAFRGSRSQYFLQKTKEFPLSLTLSESFRSSSAVLEAVNTVFSRAMTEETCGLDYENTAQMRGGARYGEHGGEVRFVLVPSAEKGEARERGVYSVLAPQPEGEEDRLAHAVVRLVKQQLGTMWFDADEGKERPVGYGDIAVLARTNGGAAARAVRALGDAGIPVAATADVNVCDFWEARLILDWLSFLDNGEQDIPMAGAMLSVLGGLTERDLAAVRIRFPSAPAFRTACRAYAEKMNDALSARLNDFFALSEHYRLLARVRSACETIGVLLSDGLEAEILSKEEGELRLRRVLRLAEEAEGSVPAFLRRLKAAEFKVDFRESGGENAVKVLTMHASKGLEYPVVILLDMDRTFHGAETDEVLYSDGLSFAPKSFEKEVRAACPTLHRSLIAAEQEEEDRKGELNLLYVAMTRAKYKLFLVFLKEPSGTPPALARSFSDLVGGACFRRYLGDLSEEQESAAFSPPSAPSVQTDALSAVYARPYPFEESTCLPVKSSATELLKLRRAEWQQLPPEEEHAGGGHSAEEGTAYHAFLQHVRFGVPVREELARMREEGLLSEEQLALLDEEKLGRILSLPSLREAAACGRVLREQTFLLSLTAREAGLAETDDTIVFQGAVDLLAETKEGWLLLDHKFSSHSEERLRRDYAPQIALYKKAVAKAMRVSEESIRARILNIALCRETEMDGHDR